MKSCFVAKISGPQKTGRIAAELLGKNCEWKFPSASPSFREPLEHSLNERTRLERSVELTDEALTSRPGEAFPIENIDYKMADSSDLLL